MKTNQIEIMTRGEFTGLMKELVAIRKDGDNLNVAFRKLDPDFNYISFGRYQTLILKTLRLAMRDKGEWIDYWVYELDCGKDAKAGTVKSKSGKSIPIKSISDLYSILTNPNL